MTFISTPPTTPGFYAWRDNDVIYLLQVNCFLGKLCSRLRTQRVTIDTLGGEWCRLVPAEEATKAGIEFFAYGRNEGERAETDQKGFWQYYNNSRAKLIAEGKE